MIVQRIEKHMIRKSSEYYHMLLDFSRRSKNLYNHANFLIRQEFLANDRWIRYEELDKTLKSDVEFDDYRKMPTAQSAQQVIRLLDKSWKSFFASIKDWSANPEKYLGRPKLPKYKSKSGHHLLVLTNQDAKLKEDKIVFPKAFRGLTIRPNFVNRANFISFQQVRFIPNNNSFCVELVYNLEVPNTLFSDNARYLSIDIGLDNLATIVNNVGITPIIINGKGLKSINRYYNRKLAHYRGVAKQMNDIHSTARTRILTDKRNRKIEDYMHKASRYIVDYAVDNQLNTIIIGNNKNWKQGSSMCRLVNQSFVGLPHSTLIEMIQYKAQEARINVIVTEESYTSGTSFLDGENPTKDNYQKCRRIRRGLFVSNNGTKINADVNGAYQIMKKVFSNAEMPRDIGFVLNPVVVSV